MRERVAPLLLAFALGLGPTACCPSCGKCNCAWYWPVYDDLRCEDSFVQVCTYDPDWCGSGGPGDWVDQLCTDDAQCRIGHCDQGICRC